jgi:phosphoribosylformylglycinamidine synthase
VLAAYRGADVPCQVIGDTCAGPEVTVHIGDEAVLNGDVRDLRDLWEETSFRLDSLQANPECVERERTSLRDRTGPTYQVPFEPRPTPAALLSGERPRVAILREEGSNGDREMTSAFFTAGFEPWDVAVSDIAAGRVGLEQFRGVVAVGGFSYADVLDSAKGWAGVVRFNDGLRQQFANFYQRDDTFSLGICNGCQLLALLGWVPWTGIADTEQPRFIQNSSGRFESRFSTVRIEESPAIMLGGMAGSILGVWVAHGEGRAYFPSSDVLARVRAKGLAPVRYVDDAGEITEAYPFNPNGSPSGIAALCSPDGRHLAMMPHPERAFLTWQWPWMPNELRGLTTSPWLRMFQNARAWCSGQAWL